MIFDFSQEEFFDNHTHYVYTDKTSVTKEEFLTNYFCGKKPIVNGQKTMPNGEQDHIVNQGVVLTLINYMSQFFNCDPTLDAVLEARKKATSTPELLQKYIRDMYAEEHIIGTVLDSDLPMGAKETLCFPCTTLRLYQYEKPLFSLIESEATYDDVHDKTLEKIREAVAKGFVGLKGHVGEHYGFDLTEVNPQEARSAFQKAKEGDKDATRKVYMSVFSDILTLCGDLDIPIHLHTGSTGLGKYTAVYEHDPILMVPFIQNPKYEKTKFVLLHTGYPFVRNLGIMVFNLPNVYMDMSHSLPWWSLSITSIFEDVIATAPHDKIMLGTGQHWYNETAWMGAKVAKTCLARIMDNLVDMNLISKKQAEKSARMILSENAKRLYHLQ